MRRGLRAILLYILLVALAALIIAYFNSGWVVIRLPSLHLSLDEPLSVVEYEMPVVGVMAVGAAAGFLLALMIFFGSWIRRQWERRKEKRFIDNLEGELTDLRNLPVTNPAPLEDLPEVKEGAQKKTKPRSKAGRVGDDSDEALLAAALREADEEPGA